MHILIAEDSKLVRRLLIQLTDRLGLNTIAFENGKELWDHIQGKSGNMLILCDWEMPLMDGLELTRRIREHFVDPSPYILMLTARDGTGDVVDGLKSGANDYVTKPFSNEELVARLEVGIRTINLQEKLSKVGEELLTANMMASVGQLAAGAAHEINNPVGYVRSNVETLRDYNQSLLAVIDELTQKIADPTISESILNKYDFDFIKDDLQPIMTETLNGLKRVQNITAGMREFARDQHLIRQVNSVVDLLPLGIDKQANIAVVIEKDLKVEGDPERLRNMLSCIIANAEKAVVRNGGKINISAASKNENEIVIKIADNGIGMDDVVKKHAFQPFYTTHPIGQNVGMGLTTALNIANQHRGDITIESIVDKGTIVEIVLPIVFQQLRI